MSALDKVIENYRQVNPIGSSHQQLCDDAEAELRNLRVAVSLALNVLRESEVGFRTLQDVAAFESVYLDGDTRAVEKYRDALERIRAAIKALEVVP